MNVGRVPGIREFWNEFNKVGTTAKVTGKIKYRLRKFTRMRGLCNFTLIQMISPWQEKCSGNQPQGWGFPKDRGESGTNS